jgi:hypothetical protein
MLVALMPMSALSGSRLLNDLSGTFQELIQSSFEYVFFKLYNVIWSFTAFESNYCITTSKAMVGEMAELN